MVNKKMELSREAESKLRTLVECLGYRDASEAVNELFYQTLLNQDPDRRKMMMAIYQINAGQNQAGI